MNHPRITEFQKNKIQNAQTDSRFTIDRVLQTESQSTWSSALEFTSEQFDQLQFHVPVVKEYR